MRISKFILCTVTALALSSFSHAFGDTHTNNEPRVFILNNDTTEKQFIFFAYTPHFWRKYATIFTIEPSKQQSVSYPASASDKYIQLLGGSPQVKVTGGNKYNLASLSEERQRNAPYQITSWGTIFITNDTKNPKTVQFSYGLFRYNIFLGPDENITVPYSKHILDTTLGNKTIHVLGSKAKKMVVHDQDNYCVTELLLNK